MYSLSKMIASQWHQWKWHKRDVQENTATSVLIFQCLEFCTDFQENVTLKVSVTIKFTLFHLVHGSQGMWEPNGVTHADTLWTWFDGSIEPFHVNLKIRAAWLYCVLMLPRHRRRLTTTLSFISRKEKCLSFHDNKVNPEWSIVIWAGSVMTCTFHHTHQVLWS